jgi:cell pole-organizing protein PopZ
MTQAAKAQEPSMEEILASIRRIIADDEPKPAAKPEAKAETKAPEPAPASKAPKAAPSPPAAAVKQDDIDAMLAGLDEKPDPAAEKAKPAAKTEDDVLELTEAMQAPAPAFRKIEGGQDVVFDDAETGPEPEVPPRAAPSPPPRAFSIDAPMLSPAAAAAVDSAFNTLARTVMVQNSRTLDDLVKEMLRPMLQQWLDNNLPTLVERLVRQEIERVARGS